MKGAQGTSRQRITCAGTQSDLLDVITCAAVNGGGTPQTYSRSQKTSHCARYHSDMQQKHNPTFINVTGERLNKQARTTRRPWTPGIQTPVQGTCARGTRARTRFRIGPAVVFSDSSIRITTCLRTIARGSQRKSLRCRGCRCGERRNSLSSTATERQPVDWPAALGSCSRQHAMDYARSTANGRASVVSTLHRSTKDCHRTDVLREAMGRCLCNNCVERDKPTTLSLKITARKRYQVTQGPPRNRGFPGGPRPPALNTVCSQTAHDCPHPREEGPKRQSSNS